MRSNLVDVTVEYLHQTELAVLVKDGDKEVWLPKLLVESDPDLDEVKRGDAIEVTGPEYLFKEKGLI